MKYLYIFIIMIAIIGCHSKQEPQLLDQNNIATDTTTVNNTKTSNVDKLKTLFLETIRPVYLKEYPNSTIPTNFKIDSTDTSINAGAAFGYLEVSVGLVDTKQEYIQVFTICHELGHIVTLEQATNFGLESEIPSGPTTNAYKKAEYLADLIAAHMIIEKLTDYKNEFKTNLDTIEQLFDKSDSFTHPSANNRITSINNYLNTENSFKSIFIELWNMD